MTKSNTIRVGYNGQWFLSEFNIVTTGLSDMPCTQTELEAYQEALENGDTSAQGWRELLNTAELVS